MDQREIKMIISRKIQELPFEIVACVLFGSWVKGNAREASDADLLIVIDKAYPEKEKIPDIIHIKRVLVPTFPLEFPQSQSPFP